MIKDILFLILFFISDNKSSCLKHIIPDINSISGKEYNIIIKIINLNNVSFYSEEAGLNSPAICTLWSSIL